MIEKIISGGQTGADQAGLDAAIKFHIPHGGWIPRGRKTEQGPLPEFYQLQETWTADYRERTRLNILESQGTVIFTRGFPAGGSKLTRSLAIRNEKPCCHIDLETAREMEGALILQSFITGHGIDILNVAGSRASHDRHIYGEVKSILETAFYLLYQQADMDKLDKFKTDFHLNLPAANTSKTPPDTVLLAAETLAARLSMKPMVQMARMPRRDLFFLYHALLEDIQRHTGLDRGNHALLRACANNSHIAHTWFTQEDAVMEILNALKDLAEQKYALGVLP